MEDRALLTVNISDSFNRTDATLAQAADNAFGGTGSHYYLDIFTNGATISSNRLQNVGLDLGGVQFTADSTPDDFNPLHSGENIGQNLNLSASLLVPRDASGNATQAGPYFRSRAAARNDGIVGGTSAGYWVKLLSTGEVAIRPLNTVPGGFSAYTARPTSFDSTAAHVLEVAFTGTTLEVSVDGQLQTFLSGHQGNIQTTALSIPDTSGGSNDGTGGIAFAADSNRGLAGGQSADNLIVSTYSTLSSLPVSNNFTAALDYGDAPDASDGPAVGNYNTRGVDNGPSHVIVAGLFMGSSVDGENDAAPSAGATGDDTTDSDDEDGVNGASLNLAIGSSPSVSVNVTNTTGSAATLAGWIDYNGNGRFDNGTERATVAVPNGTSGPVTLVFPIVPSGAAASSFARFRLSTDAAGLNAVGAATDGEVEDYAVTIAAATTTVTLDGSNNLVITDTASGGKADTLTIKSDTTNDRFVITDPNNTLSSSISGATQPDSKTVYVPFASVSGSQITFNTLAGNDSLSVDFSLGNFSKTISYDGGTQTASDSLTLTGGSTFATVTHTSTSASAGTIDVTGNSQISYLGLEPITDNLSATDRVFAFTGGSETITVTDGTAADGKTSIDSTLGESVYFTNPTGSLTINAGTGNDTVTVTSVDAGYNVDLTINGDADSDTVNLNGDITFASGENLIVTADSVNTGANADLTTSGAGVITLTADDMAIDATSTLVSASIVTLRPQTANRPITLGTSVLSSLKLSAAELGRVTAGTFRIGSTSSGAIDVTEALDLAGTNRLSLISGGAIIQSQPITEGELALDAGLGITFSGSTLNDVDVLAARTTTGSNQFIGFGGLMIGTVDGIAGMRTGNGPIAITMNSGNVTVLNTSEDNDMEATTSLSISIAGNEAFFTINAGADVETTGSSAVSQSFHADNMDIAGTITASATGAQIVNLTSGDGGEAFTLGVNGDGTADTVELSDAELDRITVSRLKLGTTLDVDLTIASAITPANITTLELETGGNIVDGTGTEQTDITVNSLVLMTSGVGGAGSIGSAGNGDLDINVTNLTTDTSSMIGADGAQFLSEADSLTITLDDLDAGDATITLTSGTFLTSSTFSVPSPLPTGLILSNVVVQSGATLGGTGSVEIPGAGVSTVTVQSGGDVSPGNSPGVLNTENISFASGSDFNVEIDGTAGAGAVGGHDQLNVTGTVSLGGANLVVTLGYTPANGDSFVIINNDSTDAVSGTFMVGGNSIADGGTFTAGGNTFVIDYTSGTDNNDVTLTVQNATPTLTASIIGNDLVIEDIDGTGKNNVLSVSRSGSDLVISDANEVFSTAISGAVLSNGSKTVTVPVSQLGAGGKVIVKGQGGSDSLSVDVSTDLGFDVQYEGGAGTSDSLTLPSDTVTSVTHSFTNANDGSISIVDGGTRVITYTGLEPITDNLSATDRTFTFNGGAETITLTDGTASDGKMTIDSGLSESVSFTNPTGSLTINAGTGDDTVTITSVDAGFNVDLTINGGTGSDTVNLNTDITFTSGENLDVDLQNDDALPGTDIINVGTNANLILSGTGAATLKASRNISLAAGSSIASVNGAITLEANAAGTTSGSFIGLAINNAAISTTGTGNISLTGKGGGTIGSEFGVHLLAGASVSSSASGAIVITGTSTATAGTINIGVMIEDSGTLVESVDGDITITGTGGPSTGNGNRGVLLRDLAVVRSTGTAAISITGTGSGAGGSTNNMGAQLESGADIVTTGTGAVTFTGTAGLGASSVGIHLSDTTAGGDSTTSFSTTSPITLVADKIRIDTTNPTINAGTSSVTLRQKTNGTAINLGSTVDTTASTLELSDAELDRITAATVQIGNSNSGTFTVSAAIDHGNNLSLVSGAGITVSQTVTLPGSKNLSANAGGDLTINAVLKNREANDIDGTGTMTLTAANNISQNADVLVGDDAVVTATATTGAITMASTAITGNGAGAAGSSITYTANTDFTVGQLTMGAGTVNGTATTGSILATSTLGAVRFGVGTGGIINLTAGTNIGTSANQIFVRDAGGTLNATANSTSGNVFLFDDASLALGAISAGTTSGTVQIHGRAALTDANGASTNITAQNAILLGGQSPGVVTGGIGSGDALETAVANIAFNNAISGNVEISNTGTLTVASLGSVTTSSNSVGSISLSASTINTSVAMSTGTGSITLTTDTIALGATVSGTGALSIVPQTTSRTIGIGGGTGDLNLDDTELGNLTNGFSSITIGDATSGSGAIDVDSSTFNDPLTIVGGTVSVTQLNAGANNVTLTARTGAITDGGDSSADIVGDAVSLSSAGAIGASGDRVTFAANTLVTNSTLGGSNGNQFLSEDDSITIGAGDLNAGAGTITFNVGTFLTTATGSILSPVSVDAGAVLGGTGTTGAVSVLNGGSVAPGTSPGILNTGNVSMTTGATFTVELAGDDGAGAADGHDQLNVTGTVSLGNATLSVNTTGLTSGEVTAGSEFVIIANDDTDAVTGTFNGLAQNAVALTNVAGTGLSAVIRYNGGTGNDVSLVIVAATFGLASGNAVYSDLAGQASTLTLTLVNGGADVQISDSLGPISAGVGATQVNSSTVTIPVASIAGNIQINTAGGDDSLAINFGGGNFSKAISYDGGTQTSSDSLTLTGGSTFTTVTHGFTNASTGTVDVTGDSQISYAGLEPVTDNLSATNRVFTFNGGDETVTLSDDANAGDNESRIDSTLGEVVTFTNPTMSLTVNLTSGADTLNVEGLDSSFNANLSIDGDGGDNLNFQTNTTDLDAGNLTVTDIVNADFNQPLTTTGTVSLTVTGAVTDDGTTAADLAAASLTVSTGTGVDLDTTITTLTSASVSGTGAINISDTAGGLTVTSATTTDGAITLNATSGTLTLTTVTAGGTANITATTTTSGNILVGNVTATSDTISLTAVGDIDESGSDTGSDLSAAIISLSAGTGIGDGGQIEIDANTTSGTGLTASVSGTGGINVRDTDGVRVASASTADGSITLEAGNGSLELVSVTAGGTSANIVANTLAGSGVITVGTLTATGDTVTLSAFTSIADDASNATTIAAATASLTSNNGAVGATGANNEIDTNVNTLSVNSATANGNQFLRETSGLTDLNLDAGGGNVTLTLAGGSIVDTAADGNDIVGNALSLSMTAGTGNTIGSSGNRIEINGVSLTIAYSGNNVDNDAFLEDTAGGLQMNNASVGSSGSNTTLNLLVTGGSLTSLVDGTRDVGADVVVLQVTGAGSTIGVSSANPLEMNAITRVDASTAGGVGDDVFMLDTDNGMPAGLVNAGSGNVDLRTTDATAGDARSITEGGTADAAADIVGTTISLTVTGTTSTIGASGATLEINATTLNATTANGSIFLEDTSGGLAAGSVSAGSGNVTLTVTSGSLTSAAGDSGTADIVGATLTLAVTGAGNDLGTSTSDRLEINAATLSASTAGSAGSDMFLDDRAGGISLTTINAGASGVVDLVATSGAITDGNAASNNITALSAALTASGGIGSGDALETTITNIAFSNSTSGNVQVANTGALTVASVGTLTTSSNSAGAITLSATGNLTVNVNLDPTTVQLDANDDVIINAAVTATTLIDINAGLDASGSATVGTAGTLTVTAAGSDITIDAGTSSGSIALNGNSTSVTAVDDVTLTASAGAITTNDNTGTDLSAADVSLSTASSGIGTTTNFVRLSAGTITAATSGNGAINLVEADSVNIGDNDLNAGSGTITLGGGTFLTTATGSILSPVTVSSGATLGGTGSTSANAAGAVTVQSGGDVSPGTSPGILNTGNVSFASGSDFDVEIDGTAGAGTVGGHDQLNVTGTVSLGGANLVVTLGYVPDPSTADSFTIINNDSTDAVSGTFTVGGNSIPEGGSFIVSDQRFSITYAGGTNSNDVILTEEKLRVNLSVDTNAGTEAGTTVVTVTATAEANVTGDQTIDVVVSGTGITIGDYTWSNSAGADTTLTIADGTNSASVTFTIDNDQLLEGTQTATLTLANPSSRITLGTTTSQDITITDNETGVVNFQADQMNAETVDPTVKALLTIMPNGSGTVGLETPFTVTATRVGGTATIGVDFATFGSQVLSFSAASGSATIDSSTATIDVTSDRRLEGDQTIDLSIAGTLSSTLNGLVSINDGTHTDTIIDDETGIIDFQADQNNLESVDPTIRAILTITPIGTGTVALEPSLTVTASDLLTGSATSGTDYAAFSPAVLTFAANSIAVSNQVTSSTAPLDVVQDRRTDENPETVNLTFAGTLSSSLDGQASEGDTTHTATITDDDSITIVGAATVNEASPYNVVVTVNLSPSPDATTDVTVNWDDGTPSTTFTPLSNGVFTIPHVYTDGMPTIRNITVDLTEDPAELGGGDITYTNQANAFSVTVLNVAPTLDVNYGPVTYTGTDLQNLINTGVASAPSGSRVLTGSRLDFTGTVQTGVLFRLPLTPANRLQNGDSIEFTITTDWVNLSSDADLGFAITDGTNVVGGNFGQTNSTNSFFWLEQGTDAGNRVNPVSYPNVASIPRTMPFTVKVSVSSTGITVRGTNNAGATFLYSSQVTTTLDLTQALSLILTGDNVGESYGINSMFVQAVGSAGIFTNSGPINEGSTGTVFFSRTPFDPSPEDRAAPLKYSYDFDNDGTWDVGDGTYAGGVTTSSVPIPATFNDGTVTRQVRGRVMDKDFSFDDDGDTFFNTDADQTADPGESNDNFSDYVTNVVINNVAPTIALTGNASVNEGSVYTLNLGAITDPGQDTVTAYSINWGDGTTDNFIGNPTTDASQTHTYADGTLTRTITVSLTDEDGTHANAGTKTITVNNVVPTIAVTGAANVNEGSTYMLSLGAITDPGADTVIFYEVNWGDGQLTQEYAHPTGLIVPHVYLDGAAAGTPRTITVRLSDEDGDHFNAGSLMVTVDNVAPTVNLTGNSSVVQGDTYTLNGLNPVIDPGADSVTSYIVDWGDGTMDTFSNAPHPNSAFHVYSTTGDFTISVTLIDEDGTFAGGTKMVSVTSAPTPTIVLTGNATTNEGSLYTLNMGTVSNGGTISGYSINWGDGVTENFSGSPASTSKTHTYADGVAGGTPRTITVSITNGFGTFVAGTKSITVNNVTPTIALSGTGSATTGVAYSLNLGAITDPGMDTISGYSIDWGDGSAVENFSGSPVGQTKTHTYASAATFTITVSLTDEDGTFTGGTHDVTVVSSAPSIVLSGNATTNEGSLYTLNMGAVTNGGTISGYSIDWGDGVTENFSGSPANTSKTHTYADGAAGGTPRTITVSITNGSGTFTAGTKNITVNNVAPTIALSGTGAATTGVAYSLNLGAITDPGMDIVTGYSIDWGDGSAVENFAGSPVGQTKTHTYSTVANRTVTVSLTDEDGTFTGGTHLVTVSAPGAPPAGFGPTTYTGTDLNALIVGGGATAPSGSRVLTGGRLDITGTVSEGIVFQLPLFNAGTFTAADSVTFTTTVNWDMLSADNDFGIGITDGVKVVAGQEADNGRFWLEQGNFATDRLTSVAYPANANLARTMPFTVTITVSPTGIKVRGTNASGATFQHNSTSTINLANALSVVLLSNNIGEKYGIHSMTVQAVKAGATLSGGELLVNGTGANDTILVRQSGDGSQVIVDANFNGGPTTTSSFAIGSVTSVRMLLGTGDDKGFVRNNGMAWTMPSNVSGEDGNDLIVTAEGNDTITGGRGRDFLIGGAGADNLDGGAGEDLLISGSTSHDASTTALTALMAEWAGANTYATRLTNLQNGTGATAGNKLIGNDGATQTVFTDTDVDTLTGAADTDAFWANLVNDNGGALDLLDSLPGESAFDADL